MRNHFAGCFGEDAIKARYRELCRKFHPDLNPLDPTATRTMQDVNTEYAEALRQEYRKTKSEDDTAAAVEADEATAAVLSQIITLPEIVCEIVGTWLWVTGNTFPVKDQLKEAGLKWASKKKAWYWHAPEDGCRGGKKSLDEIKAKYGARVVPGMSFARLA
jgi:hypothetical protein